MPLTFSLYKNPNIGRPWVFTKVFPSFLLFTSILVVFLIMVLLDVRFSWAFSFTGFSSLATSFGICSLRRRFIFRRFFLTLFPLSQTRSSITFWSTLQWHPPAAEVVDVMVVTFVKAEVLLFFSMRCLSDRVRGHIPHFLNYMLT